ncbi:MAG: hypothetical protein EXS13_05410 [Planctomycetes bacterium]|nr:hypothetical protein [Planctomycetota bacterium]
MNPADSPLCASKLDVVLLTQEAYEAPTDASPWVRQVVREDTFLLDACRAVGLRAERVAWSNPRFDWRTTRSACFRSTWDYFHRFGEFSAWLDRAAVATRLINDAATVRWNLDKRYLLDLARAGVPIVPTEVLERGSRLELTRRLDTARAAVGAGAVATALIIKPAVSGAARETWRVDAANVTALTPHLERLLAAESLLVQPFRHEIAESGELSLIVIAGRFSHAVRKLPKSGDFRVQDDHGGTVATHAATTAQIAFAERAVAAAPRPPLYARVDFIESATGPELMELELIEPELFFRFRPEAAIELARAIAAVLDR